MAVTGSGRGPIKVGSGYIDVFPKLNQEHMRKTRAQLEKQMGASGKAAGKTFVNGVVGQMATIPKKAKEAAQKAQREIQKSAQDSKKTLKRIEQEITRDYGKEAGKRFREAAELEKKKQKLLESTSAATRRAVQATVREEQQAARTQARAWQVAESERLRLIREREKAAAKAAREEAAAHRRAHLQMREDIRRTLAEARTARLADLRSQMDAHRDQLASLRGQLRTYRRQMDDHTRSVGRSLANLSTAWRRQGEHVERLGTNITETGRLVSTNLLAPLGAVSAMLTTIGVQSADMRILGQLGLSAAGVSKQKSASEMRNIQQYAIDTPFSVDTMHEYQMKLIRSIAGNDAEWYKPKTKGAAADRAADKTTDIIKTIGDTMARAGNLDPEMFKRAMYAVDRIMDMDKAPTRNINQLVQATGIPAGELARMFGYKNAGAFWKQVGTPVAKGGGISGQDMIDNLLEQWDPNYFVKDKNGKRKIDPKTNQPVVNQDPHSTKGGSAGFGEQMTSATITGRISQMKEQAQYSLGNLFVNTNEKTGEMSYTGLGQMIMGKPVDKVERVYDKKTGTWEEKKVGTEYEGGLLNQLQELGTDQKDNIIMLIKTSIEGLSLFAEQIKKFSDWLNEHPEIKETFAKIIKLGAVLLPFIIAIGIATKVLGKIGKIGGAALKPVGAAARGARGGVRTVRQTAAGARSARNGGGFRQGYRDSRTQLRGGDTRGPVARTRDRITGRDSGANQLRTQMRDTEDAISDTEEAIRKLQREIRNVNATSVRQLVDQFAGTGSGTLQGAARNARNELDEVDNRVGTLNRASLSTVGGEVNGLDTKVKNLRQEVEKTNKEFGDLNGKSLNQLKLTVDSAHGTVGDLKNKVENTALEVSSLNRKKLDSLEKEFKEATSACGNLLAKVKETIREIGSLNKAKLGTLKQGFKDLRAAVNNVFTLVGTSKSGLHGRVVNLDNRGLGKITKAVDSLKKSLDEAGKKAKTLDDRLEDIGKKAPGKGGGSTGGSSKNPKKKATGGVLPGYTPGMDVHYFSSPTAGELHLSGGEAIMRPEFTAALGEGRINSLNQAARAGGVQGVRKAMQFKDGGVLGKLGLDTLMDFARFNTGPDILGAAGAVSLYQSSDALGGNTQKGIQGAGKSGTNYIGADMGKKFKGMYDWTTSDVYDLLKKAPIPDGVSQIIGILGGAIAPVSADYFWKDVWVGKGNVLERGYRYLNDMFSVKTLKSAASNLFGGAWDSIKSLWAGGKALIQDPVGVFKEGVGGLWEMSQGTYNGFVDMVKGLREIMQNPVGYGIQAAKEVYETAKDNLPNLEGLFNFSGPGLRSAPPNVDGVIEGMTSTPGVGDSVTRWTPQVKMALAQLGLPASALDLVLHRIKVESGGNPKAINNWDINAKNGVPSQGLMQTIPPTFAAYAGPYKSRGITDPMASIYAGLNYAKHRYGSGWMKALSGNKGYATGTDGADRGWAWVGEEGPELVNFEGGETVLNARDSILAGKEVERGYASGTKNSGLYKGMVGSTSQLNTALGKLRDLLSKAFSADLISKSKHGSLSKWLEKENKTLTKAASKRATVAQKIKDANAKLAGIQAEKTKMSQDISSQASGGTPLLAAFNSGSGASTSGALTGLQDRLKAINEFKANMTALRKKGFGNAILGEVASAGLEQGNEMAKALLTATSSQVKDITKTYDSVFTQSDALGKSVSGEFYKAGETSAKALIKGLQSEEKSVLKGITSLVEKAISKLRKELKTGKGTAVRSDIASLLTWLTGVSQPAKSTTKKTTKKKGYASGTLSASPGLAVVGERGREIVDFGNGGARVYNNGDTESLLSSSSRPIQITVYEAKSENTTESVLRAFRHLDTMYGNR
ncbi:transglycosylase SLT domain-containing protein [Streptomyces halstedii]|uniref:transglycosylase SLT domain-containing protein n=1 Tax=Streptomyces halstedii TaxID=1944 RepID=UPI0037F396F9